MAKPENLCNEHACYYPSMHFDGENLCCRHYLEKGGSYDLSHNECVKLKKDAEDFQEKSDRLDKWIVETIYRLKGREPKEGDISGLAIAILTGKIEKPDWLTVREKPDKMHQKNSDCNYILNGFCVAGWSKNGEKLVNPTDFTVPQSNYSLT